MNLKPVTYSRLKRQVQHLSQVSELNISDTSYISSQYSGKTKWCNNESSYASGIFFIAPTPKVNFHNVLLQIMYNNKKRHPPPPPFPTQ
jgi:hypothetical protein